MHFYTCSCFCVCVCVACVFGYSYSSRRVLPIICLALVLVGYYSDRVRIRRTVRSFLHCAAQQSCGWFSKLGSLFNSPKHYGTLVSKKDPK